EVSDELFIVADKFHDNTSNLLQENRSLNYLNAVVNEKSDTEQQMNILEQKLMYRTLHGVYKVALQKALVNKSKSQHLIKILQEFAEENDESEKSSNDEYSQNESSSDKENTIPNSPCLQNSKENIVKDNL
ncbi:6057_t:CDS:1, partial [Scutellospora calospora]